MRVGLITIGHSPRVDVVPEIRAALPNHVEILERGALDGLDQDQISRHRPTSPGATLVSRLRDGTEVQVDKHFVHGRLREMVREMEGDVDLIGLLCSATFDRLRSARPLVLPHELLRGFLTAVSFPSPVGVLVPSPSQAAPIGTEFRAWGIPTVVVGLSPYSRASGVEEAVQGLVARGVAAIVLDCFGYGLRMKRTAESASGLPVISVLSLLICTLSELVGSER